MQPLGRLMQKFKARPGRLVSKQECKRTREVAQRQKLDSITRTQCLKSLETVTTLFIQWGLWEPKREAWGCGGRLRFRLRTVTTGRKETQTLRPRGESSQLQLALRGRYSYHSDWGQTGARSWHG